jgi:hypothetical protein
MRTSKSKCCHNLCRDRLKRLGKSKGYVKYTTIYNWLITDIPLNNKWLFIFSLKFQSVKAINSQYNNWCHQNRFETILLIIRLATQKLECGDSDRSTQQVAQFDTTHTFEWAIFMVYSLAIKYGHAIYIPIWGIWLEWFHLNLLVFCTWSGRTFHADKRWSGQLYFVS